MRATTIFPTALMAAAVFMLFPCSLPAQDGFSQAEVQVDVTGANATEAREKAIVKAQQDAFGKLMERLAPTQAKEKAALFNAEQINSMVQGFEVVDEKITSNRYRATIRVAFDPEQIRKVTGHVGGAPMEITSGATLVLPVWHAGDQLQLWEDENPWRRAWGQAAVTSSGGRLVVPAGDLTDVSALDASSALTASFGRLEPTARRYGAGQAVVAEAKAHTENDITTVDVTVKRLGARSSDVAQATFEGAAGEPLENILFRAAADVGNRLLSMQGEFSLDAPNENEESRITVISRIESVKDWVILRQKLLAVPAVTGLELAALSPTQVDMVLRFRGAPERLVQGIQGQGLALQRAGNYWVLVTQ